MPSSVLERRPDVRASAPLVRARAARLGSAKADLLPRFHPTVIGLDGHVHLDGLPGLSGTGGLIGIGADLAIFNARRLPANVAANDARLHAALAQHDKVALRTLDEVDNACGVRRGFARSNRVSAGAHLWIVPSCSRERCISHLAGCTYLLNGLISPGRITSTVVCREMSTYIAVLRRALTRINHLKIPVA